MKCKFCQKEYTPHSNHSKYCSIECRHKQEYINRGGAEFQREYLAKRRCETYGHKQMIKCQICKKYFRQVGTHIVQAHGITAREYREAYGFDLKRGQLPEDLREIKAEHVFENGTVNNLKAGKKFHFKKGQAGVGVYKRSAETMERLKAMKQLFPTKK